MGDLRLSIEKRTIVEKIISRLPRKSAQARHREFLRWEDLLCELASKMTPEALAVVSKSGAEIAQAQREQNARDNAFRQAGILL